MVKERDQVTDSNQYHHEILSSAADWTQQMVTACVSEDKEKMRSFNNNLRRVGALFYIW